MFVYESSSSSSSEEGIIVSSKITPKGYLLWQIWVCALQAGNTLKLDVIIKNPQAIIDKAEALRGEGSGPAARSQIASEK